MQIEEGKTYRAANGDKIGPMIKFDSTRYPDSFIRKSGDGFIWSAEGKCVNSPAQEANPSFDLVALWYDDSRVDSPIRIETVTTRRIEPGVYGRLQIKGSDTDEVTLRLADRSNQTEHWVHVFNAPELRQLARVALELAEYLEGVD